MTEIDKFVVERFPVLNHKPALMRAYKRTISREGGGDGNDWVEKAECLALLVNLFYFNKLWHAFEAIDTDDDRRLTFAEFQNGLQYADLHLAPDAARAAFDNMDSNHGGIVLFDEFCVFVSRQRNPAYEPELQPAQTRFGRHLDPKAAATGAAPAAPAERSARSRSPAATPEAHRRHVIAAETAAANRAQAAHSRESSAAAPGRARPAPHPASAFDTVRRVPGGKGAPPSPSHLQYPRPPWCGQAEKEILALKSDPSKVAALWRQLDFNNNGVVSLAGPLRRRFGRCGVCG